MLLQWRKFKGWSVLEYFLSNPESGIHIKGLARELDVSPQTSNSYLRLYENENILDSEPIGNLVQFRLNNRNPFVRELKRMYIQIRLHESSFIENFVQDNPGISHIFLYGAYASGDFLGNDDIDFLVISKNRKINHSAVKKTEKSLGKEFHVKTYTTGEWQELVNKDDELIKSVLSSHIMLYWTDEEILQIRNPINRLIDILPGNLGHVVTKMNYVCEEE